MTQIGALFANEIGRPIEEVIKVDQTDESVIAGEIDEYIATDSIKRHFLEVLERYQETPQKPHEGGAVWVSGFFGSGKSSFAKLLGLALENRSILGKPAADRFAAQVGDNKLTVVLKAINEKIPTHAVIFDVSTDRGIRSGNQYLTEIMYGLFLKSLDYAKDIDLAELEIGLEEQGRLDAFEGAYRAHFKKAWRDARGLLAFANSEASLVMHQLDPITYPHADSWAKGRAKPNLSVTQIADRIVALMDRRKPGHSLVFVIDEVGQFVARDVQKMLDLQGIVQRLGVLGRGKFWTVVTSQERLNELVSGLDDKKIELARLMDRFPLQVHLEPSDISEVTSRRVLEKNAAAQATLGKLYDDNRARLDVNTRVTADVKLPDLSRDRFVDLYPLLPYQIDLIIDVVSGLRMQGGASKHVGGANRTIIKLAQQLLIHPSTKVADEPVGSLVRLDQVYDLISGNISSDIRAKIDSIPVGTDDPLAQAVAKVICLLQFAKSPHRTAENIAAALVDVVDADSRLSEVRDALAELERRLFVRHGEDGYRIPTPAEDDWDKTRQGLSPSRGDQRQLLANTITGFWAPQPEFNLGDAKVFKAGLMIDGSDKQAGDITFRLQLADDAQAAVTEAEAARVRSQTERNSVFWTIALDGDIGREVGEAFRSEEMLKRKGRDATTADEAKLTGEERARLQRHQQELQRRLRTACLAGKIYVQGNDRSPDGASDVRKVAAAVLGQALPTVYDRFDEAKAKNADIAKGIEALLVDENLNGLPRVFNELRLVRDEGGKRVFNVAAAPLSEILAKIDDRAKYGEQATGKVLAEAFAGPPFGWSFDIVKLLTLSLLRAGAIDAAHRGQTVESATSVTARDCFDNNPNFRLASFKPRKGIDFAVIAEAAEHFRDTFGYEAKELSEALLAADIRSQIQNHEDDVMIALGQLRMRQLPGDEVLESAINEMRSIARGSDGNAILAFNAAHRSIKDAIKRGRDVTGALSGGDATKTLDAAKKAVGDLGVLLGEPDLDPGFAEAGDQLKDLLSKETFFRDLARISAVASKISEEQARRRDLALSQRSEAYQEALRQLAATPGWEQLDSAVQREIERPLRACTSGDGAGESLAQLRNETEVCPTRRDTAIRRVLEAIEGDRLATVSVSQYFVGGIETQEQLDQALDGIRDELGRLIGEGKKVIVQ